MTIRRRSFRSAPAVLNTADKAMWVTGWNEAVDALEAEQAANSRIASLYEELRKATDGGSESMTHDDALKQIAYWQDKCNQVQAVEPAAWTLTATLDKRVTTTSGYLWFSNPVNCCWTPRYTHPHKE